MQNRNEKIVVRMIQILSCVVLVASIIVTNTITYAKSNDVKSKSEIIVDEKTPTDEKIQEFEWIIEGDKIYCIKPNGIKYYGIQYIDNAYRYFQLDGALYCGWITLGERTLYFDPNNMGAMITGETIIDGNKYNILATGDLITGWDYRDPNRTLYKNKYGYDEFGLIEVNGKKYYIDETKGLLVGTFELDHVYYTNEKGQILTGDYTEDGKTTHLSNDGEFIYGWQKIDGKFTYTQQDGTKLKSGKFTIDGNNYYFDDNGSLVTNEVIGMYSADKSGKLSRMPITVDTLDAALDEILEKTGKDITKIGEYVRTNHKYKYTDKMKTREEMAVYALNNKYISCYYYEALTGLLLERAGYEVITIAGVGFVYAEHYWSLVKTTRNGIEGYYHVDSLKAKYIKTDKEMVDMGFKWTHENYPATP